MICMKRFCFYLFVLACVACRNKPEYTFTGELYSTEGISYRLSLQGNDTTASIVPDSCHRFSVTLPAGNIPFFNFNGVVTEKDGEKWQFSTPVYFQNSKPVKMKFVLQNQEAMIEAVDKGNRMLQEFRAYMLQSGKTFWQSSSAPGELKGKLSDFLQEAKRLIATRQPDEVLADYLNTWSLITYLEIVQNMAHHYGRQGMQLPEDLTSGLPEVPAIVDNPYWRQFYGSKILALSYLRKQARTPEEQIRLLKEQFRTPSMREALHLSILANYISEYPYSEENLIRLETLCEGVPGGEDVVHQYREKRFSVVGAPIPDVTFEDRSGNQHRLSDFKDKYLYIDLWASWCSPCCAEIPYLQKLEKSVTNPDVVFVSISLDENREAWEKKMDQLKLDGHQWIVKDGAFTDMLNVRGIPHFLLYGKDGKLMQYKAEHPSIGVPLRDRLNQLK